MLHRHRLLYTPPNGAETGSLNSMPAQYVSELVCNVCSLLLLLFLFCILYLCATFCPRLPGPLAVCRCHCGRPCASASEIAGIWKIGLLGHDSVRLAKRHKSNSVVVVVSICISYCQRPLALLLLLLLSTTTRTRVYLQILVYQLLFGMQYYNISCIRAYIFFLSCYFLFLFFVMLQFKHCSADSEPEPRARPELSSKRKTQSLLFVSF